MVRMTQVHSGEIGSREAAKIAKACIPLFAFFAASREYLEGEKAVVRLSQFCLSSDSDGGESGG